MASPSSSMSLNLKLRLARMKRKKTATKGHPKQVESLGQCGFRRWNFEDKGNFGANVCLFPENHLSANIETWEVHGCGNPGMVKIWYEKLNHAARDKINNAGFEHLISGLSIYGVEKGLIQSLGERWWDTTHTFHFEHVGEMTMTPTDFSAITGLRVSGKPLVTTDKKSYKDKDLRIALLGHQIAEWEEDCVSVEWLYATYSYMECEDERDVLIMVRAFLLALIGYVLFSNERNEVDLKYLSFLGDVDHVNDWNWGAAALAYQYNQMDLLCRGNTKCIGGLWRAWEVWAKEYMACIHVYQSSMSKDIFPRSIRWTHEALESIELSYVLKYYRTQLAQLESNGVDWNPWKKGNNIPTYVEQSATMTKQRVLLVSPEGGAWYLGERVVLQSLGEVEPLVPNDPPKSMLQKGRKKMKMNSKAFLGQSAYDLVRRDLKITYDEYRSMLAMAKKQTEESDEDVIPIPPWTLLIPGIGGGTDIISIPKDKTIDNFHIPDHVKHVSIGTAKALLRMIAGLHHVLTDEILKSRKEMEESAAVVQRLLCQKRFQDRNDRYHHEMCSGFKIEMIDITMNCDRFSFTSDPS